MNTKNYLFYFLLFLIVGLSACQEKEDISTGTDGKDEINLSGLLTRGYGDPYTIYLRAMVKNQSNEWQQYFHNTEMEQVTFIDKDTPATLTLKANRYYPLDNQNIHLFAFTGNLNENSNWILMNLQSNDDALLSNYGKNQISISEEGEGAIGKSNNPIELLYFRHVMTQVEVIIDLDNETGAEPENRPTSFEFTLPEVYQKGTYPITAKTPVEGGSNNEFAVADDTSGLQILKEGLNYLIPTGEDLTGQSLLSLAIDNYVATSNDLAGYIINKAPGNSKSNNLLLYPGYAYTLTFKLNRLQIQDIKVELTPWKKTLLPNDNITVIPKILNVNFQAYSQDDTNDPITKIILYTDDGLGDVREYVGAPSETGSEQMEFTLLPHGDVKSIELYTRKGLLLQEDLPANTKVHQGGNSYSLTIELAANGMMKDTDDFYLVTTPAQFIKISKAPNEKYRQTNDLELDALPLDETQVSLGDFGGIYDGQSHRISKAALKGGGMFKTNTGIIKNVRISSGTLDASDIGAGEYAGSICQINQSKIIACVNEAQIIDCNLGTVGGICGRNEGTIIGCVNTGNIEFAAVGGGICGHNVNTEADAIFACINTGKVGSRYYTTDIIGGICGTSEYNSKNILSKCFWLNGTAAKTIGVKEYAVGNLPDIQWNDVADISPAKLKSDEAESICNILNEAIGNTYEFKFEVNGNQTGSVWPIPVKH